MALDFSGIVDPTPVSDGTNGLIALARGRWQDAVISGTSMIPYIGDLAKTGKLPKYLRTVERVIELAEKSADAAKSLLPGMGKLKELLDLIPSGANKQVDQMTAVIDRFLNSHSPHSPMVVAKQLPDISRRFEYVPVFMKNGCLCRVAKGRLGVPGKVKVHRNSAAQKAVSAGTGDDAGHLIGNRFGAPGTAENLGRQHWLINEGEYRKLENYWEKKLKKGTGIEVTVTEKTIKGKYEDRPFVREIEWTEIAPNGTTSLHSMTFINCKYISKAEYSDIIKGKRETPPPGSASSDEVNVIHADFVNKKRLP